MDSPPRLVIAPFLLIVTVLATASPESETDADSSLNVVDYLARVLEVDGTLYQGVRSAAASQYLRTSWWDQLEEDMPHSTDQYYYVLSTVKNQDLDRDGHYDNEIPLSFRIDASLQGIAPFLSAYDLPIGDGFNDSRNLLIVRDDQLVFAPTEPAFLDTILYLRKLWDAGLIDKTLEGYDYTNPLPYDPVGSPVFSVANLVFVDPSSPSEWQYLLASTQQYTDLWRDENWNKLPVFSHPLGANHVEPNRPPSSDSWTIVPPLNCDKCGALPDATIGKEYSKVDLHRWPDLTAQEAVIVPYVDAMVSNKVREWITGGDAVAEWPQFQRDLEGLGLPHLLETWQNNFDSVSR